MLASAVPQHRCMRDRSRIGATRSATTASQGKAIERRGRSQESCRHSLLGAGSTRVSVRPVADWKRTEHQLFGRYVHAKSGVRDHRLVAHPMKDPAEKSWVKHDQRDRQVRDFNRPFGTASGSP